MTTEEMAAKMLDFIEHRPAVSFVELIEHLGEEAQGDRVVEMPGHENVWLWDGVSVKFIDAMNLIKDKVMPRPTSRMVYMMDGCVLTIPLWKKNVQYKEPHWFPVVFYIRTPEDQAEIDAAKAKKAQKENAA